MLETSDRAAQDGQSSSFAPDLGPMRAGIHQGLEVALVVVRRTGEVERRERKMDPAQVKRENLASGRNRELSSRLRRPIRAKRARRRWRRRLRNHKSVAVVQTGRARRRQSRRFGFGRPKRIAAAAAAAAARRGSENCRFHLISAVRGRGKAVLDWLSGQEKFGSSWKVEVGDDYKGPVWRGDGWRR